MLKRRAPRSFLQPQSFCPWTRRCSDETFQRARVSFYLASGRSVLTSSTPSKSILPPAPVDAAADVDEDLVSTTSTLSPPVFRISDFEKIETIAEVLIADHPAQTAGLTDQEHVKKLQITVRESKRVNNLGSISVAGKNALSNRLSVPTPAVNGKYDILLDLFDACHRRPMRAVVADLRTGWACLAKRARVQLRPKKNGTSVTNRTALLFSQMLNEAPTARRPFF